MPTQHPEHPAHLVHRHPPRLLHVEQGLRRPGRVGGQLTARRGGLDDHHADAVGDHVVQLAGDPAALVLQRQLGGVLLTLRGLGGDLPSELPAATHAIADDHHQGDEHQPGHERQRVVPERQADHGDRHHHAGGDEQDPPRRHRRAAAGERVAGEQRGQPARPVHAGELQPDLGGDDHHQHDRRRPPPGHERQRAGEREDDQAGSEMARFAVVADERPDHGDRQDDRDHRVGALRVAAHPADGRRRTPRTPPRHRRRIHHGR